jgi:hypothetical protein
MDCLSSSDDSAFSESKSVSNAVSQLALPFTVITVLAVSVASSPNGSAL